MEANLVTAQESVSQGIPLDLGPLLSPYRHHKQLSIRIEKLPQLSRLSNGHNNGDCTYSLKLDELQGLVYLPPSGEEPSPVTLVLRVINVDDDYATTLALIDIPVPPEPVGDDDANPKLRVVATEKGDGGDAAGEPAEAASLMSLHVRRTPETVAGAGADQTDVRKELEAELSELRQQMAASTNDAEATHQQALQAAEAALARDFVAQIKATKAQLEQDFENRLAEALQQTEAQTEEAVNARIATIEKQAEEAADRVRAEARKDFEKELSQLRQQQEAGAVDIDKVRKQALKTAEAEHARAIAELQDAHQNTLKAQISKTKEQLEAEFATRFEKALHQAEKQSAASAAAADKKVEQAEADAERAQAKAKKEFEKELSRVQKQLDAAGSDLEKGHKKELEATQLAHSRAIEDLQKTQAAALESQAATAKQELAATQTRLEQDAAARLAEALGQAKTKAEAGMAAARQSWEVKAEAALLAARKAWKAEEAERIAARTNETSATDEKQHEQELTDRLAAATRQAEEKAEQMGEARLATARQVWEADAESALSSAREAWQAAEAGRIAAATETLEAELSQLRDNQPAGDIDIEEVRKQAIAAAEAAHKAEIDALRSAHASAPENPAPANENASDQDVEARIAAALCEAEEKTEARLNKARLVWQTDADAKLATAREAWEAGVADRQTSTKKARKDTSPKTPTARERAYRQQRDWKPRRSWVVAVLVVGLIGLPLLLPEARSLVVERSTQAITGLRGQINSLRTPPPVASEPATVPATPAPLATPPVVTKSSATVDVGSANIRSGPSSAAAVIESLPRGSAVTILGSEQGWQRIRFGDGINDTGWVFGDLLSTPQSEESNQ